MRAKNLLIAAFFSLPLSASAQTAYNFSDLQSLGADGIAAAAPEVQLPAERRWGVNYSLTGAVSVDEGQAWLNTADGRLFRLDLSERDAARYDGKSVKLRAEARQSDELDLLKVRSIEEYTPADGEVVPPPYQPRRRQAVMIDDREGRLVMGNVRTLAGKAPSAAEFDWTTMTLKPELIKNIYFVKKPFAPELVAAHSFLVFTFEPGGLRDAAGSEPAGLTLSIEGRTRVGQNFSPVTGLMNKFGIIWTLSTWEDYAARTVLMEKGHLVPYPVLMSQAEKAAVLREAMRLAAVDREGEFYNTVKNNCTNNLLIIFNRVLPKERQIKMWTIPYMVYNMKATMPLMVIKNLQKRGLLGGEFMDVNGSTLYSPLP